MQSVLLLQICDTSLASAWIFLKVWDFNFGSVNSEFFVRILFQRIALRDILVTLKIRD